MLPIALRASIAILKMALVSAQIHFAYLAARLYPLSSQLDMKLRIAAIAKRQKP